MKVLTLKQPWATLVAEGIKKYEFRSWKTKYRGKILIHAGTGIDKKGLEKYKDLNLEFPSKRILAEVEIEDCLELNDEFSFKLIFSELEIVICFFSSFESGIAEEDVLSVLGSSFLELRLSSSAIVSSSNTFEAFEEV